MALLELELELELDFFKAELLLSLWVCGFVGFRVEGKSQ